MTKRIGNVTLLVLFITMAQLLQTCSQYGLGDEMFGIMNELAHSIHDITAES